MKKVYRVKVEPQVWLEFNAKDLTDAKKKAKALKDNWVKNKPKPEFKVVDVELG